MEALVYDVHGNLPALEAVIADAGDVSLFVLGGDYALFGGWPKETGDVRAAYALVHDDGRVEHRRVAYDHEASAERVRAFDAPWAQVVAERILRARADV